YMIQQVLDALFREQGLDLTAATLITQVLVAQDDPGFKDPAKFIGRTYSQEEASMLITTRGWQMKEDRGRRGWRRVVPSPRPMEVVELDAISALVDAGIIVIAGGGGGIPAIRTDDGDLIGVEAVVDKDMTSALLAVRLGIDTLLILSGVEQVCTGFRTEREKRYSTMTVSEAEKLHAEGEFPPGSMGPKIEAVCWFLRNGGRNAIITEGGRAQEALAGKTGTRFILD
ncbi:MAG: carbamate kinase, partial [Candidatus Sumerlaeia bacterium]|nr:carbamate kinase [Candidatus Sumerlaeia bacterium]